MSRINDNKAKEHQSKERAQKVFSAIKKATDNSTSTHFRVGTISQTLRDGGFPLGSWEVRGEFTVLKDAGLIALDATSAQWQLTESGASVDKI